MTIQSNRNDCLAKQVSSEFKELKKKKSLYNVIARRNLRKCDTRKWRKNSC